MAPQILTIENAGSGNARLEHSTACSGSPEQLRVSDPAVPWRKGRPIHGPVFRRVPRGPTPMVITSSSTDRSADAVGQWQDIAQTGTPIPALYADDQVTEPIPLGFAFPFYGGVHDSIQIGTNGWLSFDASVPHYTNQPLPTTAGPQTLIAPFWDDLDFGGGRRAWLMREDGRFTVQYTAVPLHDGSGACTFQVALEETGHIVFRYGPTAGDVSAAHRRNPERDERAGGRIQLGLRARGSRGRDRPAVAPRVPARG